MISLTAMDKQLRFEDYDQKLVLPHLPCDTWQSSASGCMAVEEIKKKRNTNS